MNKMIISIVLFVVSLKKTMNICSYDKYKSFMTIS